MNIIYDGEYHKDTAVLAPSQTNSQSLIRDAGAEKLMRRLEKIEIEENERAIRKEKERVVNSFHSLAHNFFRIGENEMQKLEEDELNALWHVVAHRVKRRWRILFVVDGLFCAILGILALCIDGVFLLFSPLLIFNHPILEIAFRHHFIFSRANKRIEKFTPDMIQ